MKNIERTIRHYAVVPQLDKLVEECVELAAEANRFKKKFSRGTYTSENMADLLTEMTDVYTLLCQVSETLGLGDEPFEESLVNRKLRKQRNGLPVVEN